VRSLRASITGSALASTTFDKEKRKRKEKSKVRETSSSFSNQIEKDKMYLNHQATRHVEEWCEEEEVRSKK
jgi:hypothetical protein